MGSFSQIMVLMPFMFLHNRNEYVSIKKRFFVEFLFLILSTAKALFVMSVCVDVG